MVGRAPRPRPRPVALFARELVKHFYVKRLQSLRANVARSHELGQAMQHLFLSFGTQDEQAIVFAKHPVLSHDFDARLLGSFVEREGAGGRFFDIAGSLFGETKEADISAHSFVYLFRFTDLKLAESTERSGCGASPDREIHKYSGDPKG